MGVSLNVAAKQLDLSVLCVVIIVVLRKQIAMPVMVLGGLMDHVSFVHGATLPNNSIYSQKYKQMGKCIRINIDV